MYYIYIIIIKTNTNKIMEATVGNLIIELKKDLILIRERVSGDLLKCREVSPCTAVENFQDLVKALKEKKK
jgi:hypothetical protein